MITMLNCDCLAYMSTLPDKAFELAIVDPPYGININMDMGRRKNKGTGFHKAKGWDQRPSPEYFTELFRVSQNQIIWGGNYYQLPTKMGWVFWDKLFSPEISFSDGELAWTSFDCALKKVSLRSAGLFTSEPDNSTTRRTIHPTQKPVALYKWLLSRYAKPGDRILDTHGGSGSICIACHDLGYDLTWMELDADYYAAAVKRYQTHAAQGQLFEPAPPRPITQMELI